MNTKLTLNLNKSVIEQAKYYAKSNHVSLSKLIENYLDSLSRNSDSADEISPLVASLTGVIPNDSVNEKKEYTDYLTKKYS
jgi:hypothetical protein